MKLYVVNTNGENEKCVGCNWESSIVYLLANSQDEANELYKEYEGGLCGECIAEMLMQDGYEITNNKDALGSNKKVLRVKKDEFVVWYFDKEVNDSIIEELVDKGMVNLVDVLNDVGYIPISLIENKEDIDKEDMGDDDIEEPSRKYRLEFEQEVDKK